MPWLRDAYPWLYPRYVELYGRRAYAPKSYQEESPSDLRACGCATGCPPAAAAGRLLAETETRQLALAV